VASDEIYHALEQLDKPVVVSMGSLAASGGYYISADADYIYATPHTLTGSIGVISQFVTAEELLDDVGVEIVVIAAGESKDFGSVSRDMTEDEQAYWQALIDETHDAFIQIVADGRGMSVQEVREFADGRVFTGQQALELGLVDEVGYFEDAIQKAATLGGISGDPRIYELTPDISLFDSLYGIQAGQQPAVSLETLRTLAMPTFEFRMVSP
jgi:protease-4